MSANTRLKVAVLSFAHVHAASYIGLLAAMPDVELLTTDPDDGQRAPGELRGREFAAALGAPYAETLDEVFEWGPDAVVVTSENARHRALVEAAAAAGAHVLCEKPLATSVDDAEAMIAACRDAGVNLMTAYPVRFAPEFARLREIVRAGELGDLLTAAGTNNGKIPVGDRAWFTDPALSGGGALVDHVVHVADLLDALLDGRSAERVRAVANRILHADKPQVAAETGGLVTVTYPGGVVATIDCSWSHPDAAPNWGGLTLELVGSRGIASIEPFAKHVGGYVGKRGAHLGFGVDSDALMLAEFLGAIREGRRAQPDGEAGLRSLRIVAAAQESVRTGGPVAVQAG